MKNLTKRIALTAAVVAFLAPASSVMAKHPRPLKGSIRVVPAGVPDEFHYPILTQTRSITGRVSHLGRVEGIIVQNVNVEDLSFFGNFTLCAANGDSISGDVVGNLLFTEDPDIFDVEEEITITSGTGRFAGATGSAVGEGQADRTTGEARETFRGTISY